MRTAWSAILVVAVVAGCRSTEVTLTLHGQLTETLRADDGTSLHVRWSRLRVPERRSSTMRAPSSRRWSVRSTRRLRSVGGPRRAARAA
jgi:hypothetical protein